MIQLRADYEPYLAPIKRGFNGVVYFIADPTGCVKIGRAELGNLEKRIKHLQAGNPRELKLMGFLREDGKDLEKQIHAQFAHLRIRREWFELKGELADYIGAAKQ